MNLFFQWLFNIWYAIFPKQQEVVKEVVNEEVKEHVVLFPSVNKDVTTQWKQTLPRKAKRIKNRNKRKCK